MAYGASGRLCVMVIRVGDLFHKKAKQPWSRNASASYNAASGYLPGDEDGFFPVAQKKRKGKDELPEDSVTPTILVAYLDSCSFGKGSASSGWRCCHGVH
jgi:hypothetical protein